MARCPFCHASLAGHGENAVLDARQRATQDLVLRLQRGDGVTSEQIAKALRRLAGSGDFQALIDFANAKSLYPQSFAATALNADRPSVGRVLDYIVTSGQTLDIFLSRP